MPNLSSHIQTFSVLDAPYAGSDMQLESIDGFYKVLVGGATLAFVTGAWTATVGPDIDDSVVFQKIDAYPLYDYTWEKRRQLRFKLSSQIGNIPTGDFYFTTGDVYGNARGFGLVFTDTKIKAVCGGGAGISELELFAGLTPGDIYEHLYEFIFYPGNGVYVYVDGVFIGSITTDLPTGTLSAERLLDMIMYTPIAMEGAALKFSRIQFSQDK
jgi:hypothetical protein